jgi:ABC-type transport system substrate-binding protein
MWGQLGIESPQKIIPNAQQGDRILRQSYPGIEISARGYGDHLLTRAECETVPRPPRFDGPNRGHYCNPESDRLIAQYRTSITRESQGRAIAEIARFYAQEFPMMPLFYNLTNPAVVKGFTPLGDDFAGGLQPPGYYGSYTRNAHLWTWE